MVQQEGTLSLIANVRMPCKRRSLSMLGCRHRHEEALWAAVAIPGMVVQEAFSSWQS